MVIDLILHYWKFIPPPKQISGSLLESNLRSFESRSRVRHPNHYTVTTPVITLTSYSRWNLVHQYVTERYSSALDCDWLVVRLQRQREWAAPPQINAFWTRGQKHSEWRQDAVMAAHWRGALCVSMVINRMDFLEFRWHCITGSF